MSKFNLTYEENQLCQLGFLFFEGLCEDPIFQFRKLPLIKNKVVDLVHTLQKKGVISESVFLEDDGDADSFIFEFTEEFVSVFRTPSSELGAGLINAYPAEIIVGGNAVSTNDIIEIFGGIDEFNYRYGQSVGWSKYLHTQVLDSIKWAKEQDHFGLNVTLSEFVINRVWKAIDKHQHFVDETTGHHQPKYCPI